ncbi:hypothetical protein BDK51DRAFT_37488 [Blyttiomyces helicus]|uniref:Uncharacterized protein n=1 Tax=Blyttiomyces helicus TaxID=388810 RepID=A0A4P9WME1_9FUNG|nr:hypothetical protein BDK51DRAFT_37488 [Blyttiomyces helicus]|eukprot:RKO93375.1 hypothetical protein BDK51DRAFT_37488 [Blyttiomyces helicus]
MTAADLEAAVQQQRCSGEVEPNPGVADKREAKMVVAGCICGARAIRATNLVDPLGFDQFRLTLLRFQILIDDLEETTSFSVDVAAGAGSSEGVWRASSSLRGALGSGSLVKKTRWGFGPARFLALSRYETPFLWQQNGFVGEIIPDEKYLPKRHWTPTGFAADNADRRTLKGSRTPWIFRMESNSRAFPPPRHCNQAPPVSLQSPSKILRSAVCSRPSSQTPVTEDPSKGEGAN